MASQDDTTKIQSENKNNRGIPVISINISVSDPGNARFVSHRYQIVLILRIDICLFSQILWRGEYEFLQTLLVHQFTPLLKYLSFIN